MRIFLRCVRDQRELGRVWLVLLPLTLVLPLLSVAPPMIERYLIDAVVLGGRVEGLVPGVALYAAVWLLSATAGIAGAGLLTYVSERVSLDLRSRLFAHAGSLSLVFGKRDHSGRTMSLFANDVPAVTSIVGSTIVQTLGSIVTLVVAGLLMFTLSWQLAVAAALAPPIVAAAALYLSRPVRPAARRVQEKLAEITERVQENLAGTREVVAFGRERQQQANFGTSLRELLRLRMRLTFMESGLQAGQSIFSMAVTTVILGFGAYLVIRGETTLGTVIAMRSLFGLVFGPASRLFGIVSQVQKGLASAERLYAYLDETPRVAERRSALRPLAVKGEIAFRDVAFGYRRGRPVLRDISFVARAGERVALVGPSGAGKSTLVSLVARFHDPTEGAVLMDGVDLRDLTLSGLREHVGIVFQNTFLFATSVRENIAFGREGASDAEIVAAARAANAWEFIANLPRGLDTHVGERGVLLSEGQKQRLAIARALLRDPRILILDEPTSALDARSEHLLRAALGNLMRDRTTFIIAHRLGTAISADRILVLDEGRIVQQGDHAELVASAGLYRDLFGLQFSQEPLDQELTPRVAVAHR